MAEIFSAITYEIYLNGAWTNVTADVRNNPHPRINGIGIMGNGFADRTGDAGTCEFSLDNSSANQNATQSYYTPVNPTLTTGLLAGLPVRVSFTYDGYTVYKFYGTIDTDGIKVETGKYKGRSVHVKASNWMRKAANHKIDLIQYQTNLRADQGIQNVLDNFAAKPNKITLGVGDITYPTVFDVTRGNTTTLGEIHKLSFSGWGWAFIRGGETSGEEFVYVPRTGLPATLKTFPDKNSNFTDSILNESGGTDDILLEDGGRLLLEHSLTADFKASAGDNENFVDLQVEYGKNMANRFTIITYPRSVDTSVNVLWASESPITIAAGETLTEIRGKYTDPGAGNSQVCGFNMVVPVATTDYQMFANSDGTGTDRTADLVVTAEYGTSEVRYTLTNNNAADSYVTKLQARGYGIYIYDKQEKVYDIAAAGQEVIELSLDMPYLDGVTNLFSISDKTYSGFFAGGPGTGYQASEMSVSSVSWIANADYKRMLAFMFMEPTDVLRLYETITATSKTAAGVLVWNNYYRVMGYDIEILPRKVVKWTAVLRPYDQ